MRILFGVFDWGLGHATRDTPLIEELLRKGHTVHIISTGRSLALLQQQFGNRCVYFDVPSIVSPYTRTRFFTAKFILTAPRMILALTRARKISERIVKAGRYDKVISDCRFDVYDKVSNSYLINHQLRFKTFKSGEQVTEYWLTRQQKRYRRVIVPDFEINDLTGDLSHNMKRMDRRSISYIGVLSQLKRLKRPKDIDYFISISGPEPQRTEFEKKVLSQVHRLKGTVVVTLGKPESHHRMKRKNVTIYDFLDREQQEDIMNRSKCVITRSGYTTMMELYELGVRSALLVPTPGQTEQEYLADRYQMRQEFYHVSQYELNLPLNIREAQKYTGFSRSWRTHESVRRFMSVIHA